MVTGYHITNKLRGREQTSTIGHSCYILHSVTLGSTGEHIPAPPPHTHSPRSSRVFKSSKSVFYTFFDPFRMSCKLLSFARKVIAHILLRDVGLMCVCVRVSVCVVG